MSFSLHPIFCGKTIRKTPYQIINLIHKGNNPFLIDKEKTVFFVFLHYISV
jgi:hypothetical protein